MAGPQQMNRFEIELVSREGPSLLGVALDAESAAHVMEEAIRKLPNHHIRICYGAKIVAERVPPRAPKNP